MLVRTIKKSLSALLFLYPIWVYIGIKYFSIASASFFLACFLVVRLLFFKTKDKAPLGRVFEGFLALMLVNNLLNAYFENKFLLKLYPVLMSFGFFCTFTYSLFTSEPIIESFARVKKKEFSLAELKYIRRLTVFWSGWLLANTLIALYTVLFCSLDSWLLYNGMVSYIISGLIFGGEFLYRKIVLQRNSVEHV